MTEITGCTNPRCYWPACDCIRPTEPDRRDEGLRKITTIREELIDGRFQWCIIEIIPESHCILANFGAGDDAKRLAQSTINTRTAPQTPDTGEWTMREQNYATSAVNACLAIADDLTCHGMSAKDVANALRDRFSTAPPKPAPDALREAIARLVVKYAASVAVPRYYEDRLKLARHVADRILAISAPPQSGGATAEPVAWKYELAHAGWDKDTYGHWNWHTSDSKPCVPEGSIRNLTPLYAAPPKPAPDALRALLRNAALFLELGARYAPNEAVSDRNAATGEMLKTRGLADVMRSIAAECAAFESAPPQSGGASINDGAVKDISKR